MDPDFIHPMAALLQLAIPPYKWTLSISPLNMTHLLTLIPNLSLFTLPIKFLRNYLTQDTNHPNWQQAVCSPTSPSNHQLIQPKFSFFWTIIQSRPASSFSSSSPREPTNWQLHPINNLSILSWNIAKTKSSSCSWILFQICYFGGGGRRHGSWRNFQVFFSANPCTM